MAGKTAAKVAEETRALLRKLSKRKAPPLQKQDSLQALVRAAMLFDMTDAEADQAMRLIDREFVGLNELRVATDLEIQELLGTQYPAIERRVAMITQSLNQIFEREHTMSLARLGDVSKREARQVLRELPEIHPFVEAYVMLFALDAPVLPLDDLMLDYLKRQGIFEEKATMEEAQKTLEHQLKGDECYELYVALRAAVAEQDNKKKK